MRFVVVTKGTMRGACGMVVSVDAPSGHLWLKLGPDGPHHWTRPDWTRDATDTERAEMLGEIPAKWERRA